MHYTSFFFSSNRKPNIILSLDETFPFIIITVFGIENHKKDNED